MEGDTMRQHYALMRLLYHKMWNENRPPLLALRESQLTMFRNPEKIGLLANASTASFKAELKKIQEERVVGNARGELKDWAAFVVSGGL
jgi:hypothetical protein